MKTMPEFLTAPLASEGPNFLGPDASTGGAHFESWAAKPMCSGPEAKGSATLEHLFLSSEGNFDTQYRGPKNANGGVSPLPPPPERPGVEPSGPPLSNLETSTKGTAPWRLKKVGAPDAWAGRQWGQAPPDIKEYATPAQCNAWRLRMGLETSYKEGSTPARLFEASALLWDNGFGCVDLFEDAMVTCPGQQFFARDGDGFCYGSLLKKVQWVLTMHLTQVQIMLYPDENMTDFTAAEGSVSYPRQDLKLQHMQWLFENFLLVSKTCRQASSACTMTARKPSPGQWSKPSQTLLQHGSH